MPGGHHRDGPGAGQTWLPDPLLHALSISARSVQIARSACFGRFAARVLISLPAASVQPGRDLDRPQGASTPLALRRSAVRRFRPTT